MPSSKPRIDEDAGPEYRLDDQIGFLLRRGTQRHLGIFARHIPDLTPTQFAAIAKLFEMGPVSQNELGRRTAMDAATIKGVIDRLRRRELVTTRRDRVDQRRIYVELSPLGSKLFEDSEAAALVISEQTLAPLSPEDRASFVKLLKIIT